MRMVGICFVKGFGLWIFDFVGLFWVSDMSNLENDLVFFLVRLVVDEGWLKSMVVWGIWNLGKM